MCRVSREGKKAEAGKERRQRGTKEEEHKRERERERREEFASWQTLRRCVPIVSITVEPR